MKSILNLGMLVIILLASCKKEEKKTTPVTPPPACTKVFSGNYYKVFHQGFGGIDKWPEFDSTFILSYPDGTLTAEFPGYNKTVGTRYLFNTNYPTCDSSWKFAADVKGNFGTQYTHYMNFKGELLIDSIRYLNQYNILHYQRY